MAENNNRKYNNNNNSAQYSGDDKLRKTKRVPKKKICAFCADKTADKNLKIDYKDVARIKKFITEKGKIIPRRSSGVCAGHQRELNTAIKRARIVALLPFKAE